MALTTAATSFVVAALLGSPRAGEAFTPFAVHEVGMVSTTTPSHGIIRGAINIPTSGSTSAAGTARVSRDQKRSASSNTAPSRFSGEFEDADIHHSASAIYIADEGTTTPPPTAQLPSRPAQRDQLPPPAPPEPGAGGGKACNRPWRKRARDARHDTVIHNTEGFGSERLGEGGCGDAMRQHACEKEGVMASRKERAHLAIVDLVCVVSPLVIIVGMSIVRNVS